MNANFLRGQISCLHEIVLQCDKQDNGQTGNHSEESG